MTWKSKTYDSAKQTAVLTTRHSSSRSMCGFGWVYRYGTRYVYLYEYNSPPIITVFYHVVMCGVEDTGKSVCRSRYTGMTFCGTNFYRYDFYFLTAKRSCLLASFIIYPFGITITCKYFLKRRMPFNSLELLLHTRLALNLYLRLLSPEEFHGEECIAHPSLIFNMPNSTIVSIFFILHHQDESLSAA